MLIYVAFDRGDLKSTFLSYLWHSTWQQLKAQMKEPFKLGIDRQWTWPTIQSPGDWKTVCSSNSNSKRDWWQIEKMQVSWCPHWHSKEVRTLLLCKRSDTALPLGERLRRRGSSLHIQLHSGLILEKPRRTSVLHFTLPLEISNIRQKIPSYCQKIISTLRYLNSRLLWMRYH